VDKIPNLAQVASLKRQKMLQLLPFVVTSLRLVTLPFLIFSLSVGQFVFGAFLFLLAIASDLGDGYLARRLGVSSKLGAKFDATVDFVFITGVFFYFVIQGLYPAWILGLIIFMFAQFMITSVLSKAFYDPLGKYYGGFLYGAIGLTILPFGTTLTCIITILLAGITGVSLTSRLIYLSRRFK
jgi:phosphatidylglycerophosphate synthase